MLAQRRLLLSSPCPSPQSPGRPRTIGGKTRWIRSSLGAALTLVALAALAGCERAPSADGLKEWTATDHDRAEELGRPSNGQQAQGEARGDGGGNPNALIEVAWSQNCALCHGVVGRGDGPNGPMVKAPDLTREAWQASVKDDEIAAVIKAGKGRMPKFDLPDSTVRGLIGRIRAVRGK